jgi:hypothetical protein
MNFIVVTLPAREAGGGGRAGAVRALPLMRETISAALAALDAHFPVSTPLWNTQ